MFKNLILVASLCAFSSMLPASAQVGPGKGSSDYNPYRNRPSTGGESPYAQVCTRERNGRLSFRTGPGRNYGKIKEVPNGQTVALLDGGYAQDGFWWWKAGHNGNVGWIRADYVCGDPQ